MSENAVSDGASAATGKGSTDFFDKVVEAVREGSSASSKSNAEKTVEGVEHIGNCIEDEMRKAFSVQTLADEQKMAACGQSYADLSTARSKELQDGIVF